MENGSYDHTEKPAEATSVHESDSEIGESLTLDGFETPDEDGEFSADEEEKICSFTEVDLQLKPSEILRHAREQIGWDLAQVRKDLNLDYLSTLKLVNYVRSEAYGGRGSKLDLSTSSVFEDDRYLQPVIKDDPLLYLLEEVFEVDFDDVGDKSESLRAGNQEVAAEKSDAEKILELSEALHKTRQLLKATEQRLDLTTQTLKAHKAAHDENGGNPTARFETSKKRQAPYSGNYDGYALHRSMLSDRVRTDSYRDFILGNKQLFQDKVILDVGCGTGILSLFCAEAGAKLVLAVDQSTIIDCARENAIRANKHNVIQFFHGRIQEINLPVPTVDIVVSEWMGHCLLFEGMLDAVLYARDTYLKPTTGLMVPSHTTLYLAPFSHPAYAADRLGYWDDVYGYDMSSLKASILAEIDVENPTTGPMSLQPAHLVAAPIPFRQLDIHTVKPSDLTFTHQRFDCSVIRDIDNLTGFAIWFSATFNPDRTSLDRPSCNTMPQLSSTSAATPDSSIDRDETKHEVPSPGSVFFSTGPEAEPTHWRQGLCLIDTREDPPSNRGIEAGQVIGGWIGYSKPTEDADTGTEGGLAVEIEWEVGGSPIAQEHTSSQEAAGKKKEKGQDKKKGRQVWLLQ